jgi:Uma2 family endonuclease
MTQIAQPPRRPVPERMSYEEFLAFPHENQHVEWVDGKVVPMPAISDAHSAVNLFFGAVLQFYCERKDLGVIRGDPFNMKTGPTLPGRQPDLLFLSNANISRLRPTHLEGPADLVVEVLSRATRRIDRVDKFREYEQGGVREYLLIDPERGQVELYRLIDGRYEEIIPDEQGVLRSAVINGFWFKLEWLTRRPLPALNDVLRELGVA